MSRCERLLVTEFLLSMDGMIMDCMRRSIMLMLTEKCNLRCTYCYENHERTGSMDFETAVSILDRELTEARTFNEKIRIEFFGGEIMLNFPLLRQVYEYTEKMYPDLDILYAFTTNGTLFGEQEKNWFSERKDQFVCTLSLDGTPEMHNRSRKTVRHTGSWNLIDVSFFIKNWPGCIAKMTVDLNNLPYLSEGVQYLEQYGFRCKATFASGIDFGKQEYKDVLIRELNKLAEYYIAHKKQPLCNMLDMNPADVLYEIDEQYRFCGAGCYKHCYDLTGKWYPCQGLSPLAVGEAGKIFERESFRDFHFSDESPDSCGKCKWLMLCSTCYAANYKETGNVERCSKEMCEINRLCMLTSSYIHYMRLEEKLEAGTLTEEEEQILEGVSIIQEEIPKELGMSEAD